MLVPAAAVSPDGVGVAASGDMSGDTSWMPPPPSSAVEATNPDGSGDGSTAPPPDTATAADGDDDTGAGSGTGNGGGGGGGGGGGVDEASPATPTTQRATFEEEDEEVVSV